MENDEISFIFLQRRSKERQYNIKNVYQEKYRPIEKKDNLHEMIYNKVYMKD